MGASSPPTPGTAQTVGGYNISSILGMQQVPPTGAAAALTTSSDSNINKRKHDEGRCRFEDLCLMSEIDETAFFVINGYENMV